MVSPSKAGHHPDYFLLAVIFILTGFGLVMLASASSELGKIKFNDSYYYLKRQILNGLLVGAVGFLAAAKIHYQRFRKWALLFFILSLGLVALVFTNLGVTLGGATRWLKLGPLTFQPAEILKLTFIIYLAAWLSNPKTQREKKFTQGFLPFIMVILIAAGLLLLQPATSMVIILIGSGLIVYFSSGAKFKYFAAIVILGIIGLGIITYTTPYRLERIMIFLNLKEDALGTGFHRNEALIALGSGGLLGVGYGESRTKASFLPAPMDDSIFAVIGEELGFVGAGSLVAVFGILAVRLFWIAKNLRDRFGQFLVIGLASVIITQSLINIAAISGVIPLTGVPLPFISYGGTALAVFLTMAGITVNASKYTRK